VSENPILAVFEKLAVFESKNKSKRFLIFFRTVMLRFYPKTLCCKGRIKFVAHKTFAAKKCVYLKKQIIRQKGLVNFMKAQA